MVRTSMLLALSACVGISKEDSGVRNDTDLTTGTDTGTGTATDTTSRPVSSTRTILAGAPVSAVITSG